MIVMVKKKIYDKRKRRENEELNKWWKAIKEKQANTPTLIEFQTTSDECARANVKTADKFQVLIHSHSTPKRRFALFSRRTKVAVIYNEILCHFCPPEIAHQQPHGNQS